MNKKAYQKPTIAVVPVRMSQMLCQSGGIEERGAGSFGINAYDDVDEEELEEQGGAW